MIIWSSYLTELVWCSRSFSIIGFSSCPYREVENDMYNANSYTFEACFDKDVGEFGSSWSKNPMKNAMGEPRVCKLGLLSLQFNSVSMCVRSLSPSK